LTDLERIKKELLKQYLIKEIAKLKKSANEVVVDAGFGRYLAKMGFTPEEMGVVVQEKMEPTEPSYIVGGHYNGELYHPDNIVSDCVMGCGRKVQTRPENEHPLLHKVCQDCVKDIPTSFN